MNKDLIISRFSKAAISYDTDAEAQRKIAMKMIQLLKPHVAKKVSHAVEIGCGTGIFSRLLVNAFHPASFTLNDICREMECRCHDMLTRENYSFVGCDAEQWGLPQNTDLLTSCSTFQWFRHPDIFFRKAHSALTTDGLFGFSTFGKENLREIGNLTGNSLPYLSLAELSEMLSCAGFDVLCAEEEKIVLTFDTPKDVLWHMKRTGVNGISAQKWTKSTLQRFTEKYIEKFSQSDGKVSLTYHPMYFMAKK